MQGIKINLDEKSVQQVKADFSKLLKELESQGTVGIKINIKEINKQMSEVEKQAKDTKLKIEKIFGEPIKFNNNIQPLGVSDFEKRIEDIKRNVDKLANVKINTNANGELTSAMIRYTDATGKSVTETWKLVETLDKVNNVKTIAFQPVGQTFIDNVERSSKLATAELIRLKKLGEEIRSNLTINSSNEEVANFIKGKFEGADIQKFNQSFTKTGQIVKEVSFRVKEGDDKWRMYKLAIDETTGQTRLLDQGLKDVLNRQISLKDQMVTAIKKMGEWAVAGTLLYGTLRQIGEGIKFINDMDKELTNIRMITGMSNGEVQSLAKDFNSLAKELGSTTDQVTKGSVEFFRMGKTAEETAQLIKASTMASNLSGVSPDQMTQYLTATMNGFQMQAKDVMKIVDTFVTLDNNAATSFAELAEAFQHTASSANQAGVDFGKLASWIATVSSVTRKSASSIGESFKTMFARLQDLKEGKTDEDGMAISNVEKALNKVGIALRDSKNSFRDMDDVLDDIAKKWNMLTEIQQTEIAKAIAGTRQRENFLALMQNYNMALNLNATALQSAGTAQQRYDIYLQSTEAKMNQLKATTQEFWLNLINSNVIRGGISGLTTFVGVLDEMINKSKLLGVAFAYIITEITLLIFKKATLMSVTTGLIAKYGVWGAVTQGVATATGQLAMALDALFISNPIGWFIMAAGAVLAIANNVKKHREEIQQLKKEYDDLKIAIEQANLEAQKEFVNNKDNTTNKLLQKSAEIRRQIEELERNPKNTRDYEHKLNSLYIQLSRINKELKDAGYHFDKLNNIPIEIKVAEHNAQLKQSIEAYQQEQQVIVEKKEKLIGLINDYLSLNAVENKNIDQKHQLKNIQNELAKNGIPATTDALNKAKEALYNERDAILKSADAKMTAWKDSAQIIVNGSAMTVQAAKTEVQALQKVVDAYSQSLSAMIASTGYATNYIPTNIQQSMIRMMNIQSQLNAIEKSFGNLGVKSSNVSSSYVPTKTNNPSNSTKTSASTKSDTDKQLETAKNNLQKLKDIYEQYENLSQNKYRLLGFIDENDFNKQKSITLEYIKSLEIQKNTVTKIISQLQILANKNKGNAELYKAINSEIKNYQDKQMSIDYELLQTAEKYRSILKEQYKELQEKEVKRLESEKERVLNEFDTKIKKLRDEIEALNDTFETDKNNLALLEQELQKWKKDDSLYSKQKQVELEKKIAEEKKRLAIEEKEREIKTLEEQKQAKEDYYDAEIKKVNEHYNNLLTEQSLFIETNNTIIKNGFDTLHQLLLSYSKTYSEVAKSIGGNISTGIISGIDSALNVLGAGSSSSSASSNSTSKSSSSIAWNGVVYKLGSKGAGVKRIQENLKALGYNIAVDGIFGQQTLNAIKDFQKKHGLTTDGIVGKMTWSKLIKFDTGGYVTDSGLAYLHAKERVLNPQQTKAFDFLVYNILPMLKNLKYPETAKTEVNAPLVQNKINNYNYTPFDVNNASDNLARLIKHELHKVGYGTKR